MPSFVMGANLYKNISVFNDSQFNLLSQNKICYNSFISRGGNKSVKNLCVNESKSKKKKNKKRRVSVYVSRNKTMNMASIAKLSNNNAESLLKPPLVKKHPRHFTMMVSALITG